MPHSAGLQYDDEKQGHRTRASRSAEPPGVLPLAPAKKEILLGNEALGLGLAESGCQCLASYPGTPSSEILPAFGAFVNRYKLRAHYEWSINEKVAFEVALAAAMAGKKAAVAMKQVGLNVAADPAMSSAYQGVEGGFIIIATDDPGPHSSQTEQDSRLFGLLALLPVYDPGSPAEARAMVAAAYKLSERQKLPVIIRPTTRVCHARQAMQLPRELAPEQRTARFRKDPDRWAATPRTRFFLHQKLNHKLESIRKGFEREKRFNRNDTPIPTSAGRIPLGIISSGVAHGHLMDLLASEPAALKGVPVLKIGTPHPLPMKRVAEFIGCCRNVLVLEESMPVIEYQIADRRNVHGRLDAAVPNAGELSPEVVHDVVARALDRFHPRRTMPRLQHGAAERKLVQGRPLRHPSLCPGCPHRATFLAIRKAVPRALITSDIGCYTLGKNQRAVHTVLDMGAGITLADGLHKAHRQDGLKRPVVGTIGDSTFYHSGPAALLNAQYSGSRFLVVILDNMITAMTGMQPTPASSRLVDGGEGNAIPLEKVVRGCGVSYVRVANPFKTKQFITKLKEAQAYVESPTGGMAVVISRYPCLIHEKAVTKTGRRPVAVSADCDLCLFCQDNFDCPAMTYTEGDTQVRVDPKLCASCGLCVEMCPRSAVSFTGRGKAKNG